MRDLGGSLSVPVADRHGGCAAAGPMLVELALDVDLSRERGGGSVPAPVAVEAARRQADALGERSAAAR